MKKIIIVFLSMLALSVHAQQIVVTPIGSINEGGVIRGFSTLSGGIEIVGDNLTEFCGQTGSSFIVRADGTIDGLSGVNNSYGTLITPDNAKFYYGEGKVSRNDDVIATTDGSFATALLCSNGTIAFGAWYATEINGITGNFALYDTNGLITVFDLGGPVTGIVPTATLNEIYVTTENPGEVNLHKINVETKEVLQLSELEEEISPDNFLITGAFTRNGYPIFYGWHAAYGMMFTEFHHESGWTIVDGFGGFSYVYTDNTSEYVYISGNHININGDPEDYSGVVRSKDYSVWEKFGPEVLVGDPFIFWSGSKQYWMGTTIGGIQIQGIQTSTLYRIDYETGISDDRPQISIHPNPTTGLLTIETSDLNSDIKVCNATGQLVKYFDITSVKTEIDISDLPSGLYWVNGKAVMLQK